MVIIDGITQTCHVCNSKELNISGVNSENNTLNVWCNKCEQQTLENVLDLGKIQHIEFHT